MLFSGCAKKDISAPLLVESKNQQEVIERFLTIPENASDELKFFIEDFRKKEIEHHFLYDFVLRNGTPIWEATTATFPAINNTTVYGQIKTISSQSSNSLTINSTANTNSPALAFFPLIDSVTKEIKSYIHCTKNSNGTTRYKVYNKLEILATKPVTNNDFKEKEILLSVFGYFERTINNKSKITFAHPYNYTLDNVNMLFTKNSLTQTSQSISLDNSNIKSMSTGGGCIPNYFGFEIQLGNLGSAISGGFNPCARIYHFIIECKGGVPTLYNDSYRDPCPKIADGGNGSGGGTPVSPAPVNPPSQPTPVNPSNPYINPWIVYNPLPTPNLPDPNNPGYNYGNGGSGPNPGNNNPNDITQDPNDPWFTDGTPRQNSLGAINPYFYDPNNPFDNITAVVDVLDEPLIENGIGVEDFYEDFFANNATYVIPQYRKIGVSTDRGHTEDLTSGTDGNTSGILSYYSNRTDQQLFNQMNELITACTILSPNTLLNTGIKMINKFKNGPQNPPFRDKDLDDEVANSSAMKNFVKEFRDRLSVKLKLKQGDINQVDQINLELERPIFNGLYNKFHGLQILVNDTEKTDIYLKNYSLDANGNWEAELIIEITDHFGMDKKDALNYQGKHGGFGAWWTLQHKRNYKPFITKIYVAKKINGKL